jgi:hypothetical protein
MDGFQATPLWKARPPSMGVGGLEVWHESSPDCLAVPQRSRLAPKSNIQIALEEIKTKPG